MSEKQLMIERLARALQAEVADLRAQLAAAKSEIARLADESQDWQLAADGIKHHFNCSRNVVTGDPNRFVCDRCRAEQAEAALAGIVKAAPDEAT